MADNQLWGWGEGNAGQLGDGTTENKSSPVQVLGSNSNWRSVSCGFLHTVGIKKDNTLWSWGNNYKGQLGDGTINDELVPIQIGESDWSHSSCGFLHTIAIKTDGTLWSWGEGAFGELGDETYRRSSPVQVGNQTTWKQLSSGLFTVAAIKTDGTLWAWGEGTYGQIGNGEAQEINSSPIQIGNQTTWRQTSNGYRHTVAVKTDGSLWAWGRNLIGQLGDETQTDTSSPIQIGNGTNWKQVACGGSHTTAVKTDGTLWAWGEGADGQLGNGESGVNAWRNSPTQVGNGSNWLKVSCGANFTCAIKTDKTIWTWGSNYKGRLGDGTTENKSSPVQISGDKYWSDVTCGVYDTLAITGNTPVRFNFIHPTYKFEVVTYTPESLVALAPYPDSLEHLILNLKAQEVVINNKSYRHGDQFTEFGSRAIRIKQLYVDSSDPVLKIVCDAGYRFENNRCVLDCLESETACSGVCYDLLTDNDNCGSCGNVCDSGFACVDGVCTAT